MSILFPVTDPEVHCEISQLLFARTRRSACFYFFFLTDFYYYLFLTVRSLRGLRTAYHEIILSICCIRHYLYGTLRWSIILLKKIRAFSAIHNVAYKYNLLLVLKILSYNLYNNWTDEMQAVARNNVCVCARVWIQTSYILTIHNNNHEAEEQLCKGQFTENVPTGSGRCKVCIDASKRNATE